MGNWCAATANSFQHANSELLSSIQVHGTYKITNTKAKARKGSRLRSFPVVGTGGRRQRREANGTTTQRCPAGPNLRLLFLKAIEQFL